MLLQRQAGGWVMQLVLISLHWKPDQGSKTIQIGNIETSVQREAEANFSDTISFSFRESVDT